MATKQLEARVRHQGDTAIIDMWGEIHASAEETLNAAYTEAEGQSPAAILLNFSNVTYINSTGIALIVGLLARARQSQRRLMACSLSAHYVEIFQITRLADYMHVFADEASALAA
jgi:anti-sigma B factor antagonist